MSRVLRDTTPVSDPDRARTPPGVVPRLVLGSALMLFLELALIRWLGSNIVHLSYFTNFVLLGSFLGIGLGFLIAGERWSILRCDTGAARRCWWSASACSRCRSTAPARDVIYFTSLHTTGPPAWLVLPLVFLAGRRACWPARPRSSAAASPSCAPLTAYRWDLIGSLVGIVPVHGCCRSCGRRRWSGASSSRSAFVVLVGVAAVRALAACAGIVVVAALLARDAGAGHLLVAVLQDHTTTRTGVDVRHRGSQHLGQRRARTRSMAPAAVEARRRSQDQYGVAVRATARTTPLDNVLIVGAGSGSDVAIALSQGRQAHRRGRHRPADHADRRASGNPDQPTRTRGSTRHINDGRAFLREHRHQVRPDPVRAARLAGAGQRRLADPAGVLPVHRAGARPRPATTSRPTASFAMYNYYREDWLIDRLAGTAAAAFGHDPVRRHRSAAARPWSPRRCDAGQPVLRRRQPRAAGDGDRAGHRRPAVPVLPGRR